MKLGVYGNFYLPNFDFCIFQGLVVMNLLVDMHLGIRLI